PNGAEGTFYYNGSTNYGATYTKLAETLVGMLNDGGMKLKQGPAEYQNDWLPNYHFAYSANYQGGADKVRTFSGMALRAPTFYATLAQTLFTNQHKDGSRFEGCTPDGKNAHLGDPTLNKKIEALKQEFDLNKAHAQALDIAQYVAEQAYWAQGYPFSNLTFGNYWPAIGNLGVYRTWTTARLIPETVLNWWVNTDAPPIKS
ncbi:MAG TPA: hypothetical protein VH951_01665, partial [Dehalococcoidia bacterium]